MVLILEKRPRQVSHVGKKQLIKFITLIYRKATEQEEPMLLVFNI